MNWINHNILSLLIFFPVAGAVAIALLPRKIARELGFAVALVGFVMSLHLAAHWQLGAPGFQFEQKLPWLPGAGISYHVGVDGLSMLLILLTTLLTPLVLLASWREIDKHLKEFAVSILLLEAAAIGVFSSLDLILFYIFWEAVLVPTYLLIGVWGGPRRIGAAIKFFLYTMFGSVLMWVAALYIYVKQPAGVRSFDYEILKGVTHFNQANIESAEPGIALLLFGAFVLAFAIKAPLFPLHTWLPDAYSEAPTAGTVMLAAVLSKMGVYGFLRFAIPFFPNTAREYAPLLAALAIAGIVYGALVAIKQTDIKRLVAYSSISHMGFIMLGVFAGFIVFEAGDASVSGQVAMSGAALQMVNHGISTGALFLLIGMLVERRRSREQEDFGGVAQVMPRFTILFWIALFASIGLPGLNGFVGEYLILQGTMKAGFWYAASAATGVILGAVYMLRMFRSVMFGEITHEENRELRDIGWRETFVVAALLLFAVWIGVAPQPFLNIVNPPAQSVAAMARLESPAAGRLVRQFQTSPAPARGNY